MATAVTPWGKSASIDLSECDFNLVSQAEPIKKFISEVIPLIGMQAHGPTYIERFGDKKAGLEGWSAMQFIETSSITIHADEVSLRCYVDIFSCKDFDENIALEFAKKSFGAQFGKVKALQR